MNGTDAKGAVLVTGGSRGIGARTVVRLAEAGFPVAFLYHSREDAAAAVVREVEGLGGRALAIQADVSQEEDLLRAFAEVDKAFGQLSGLVNNAATGGGRSPLKTVERSQLENVWATNITAPFICCREAVNRMSTANGGAGGAIVNVSSLASRTGSPNVWVHYAASKAALETMTIGLAKETAREGIRVNAIRCGVFDTEAHDGFGEDRLAALMAAVPMHRMGDANEAADVIEYLMSPRASYITGSLVDVSGGM